MTDDFPFPCFVCLPVFQKKKQPLNLTSQHETAGLQSAAVVGALASVRSEVKPPWFRLVLLDEEVNILIQLPLSLNTIFV